MEAALEYLPLALLASASLFLAWLYWTNDGSALISKTRFATVVDAASKAARIMKAVRAKAQKVEEAASAHAETIASEAMASAHKLGLEAAAKLRATEAKAQIIEEAAAEAASKLEAEASANVKEASDQVRDLAVEAEAVLAKINALREDYARKREVYDGLIKQVAIFDETLAFAEMGVYEPHFDFSDSDQFKRRFRKCEASRSA